MAFRIIWTDPAIQQLRKLDRPIAKRIHSAVTKLEENPTRWLKRLVNTPFYRLRVGDYRVIVELHENELIVLVLKIGPRKNIYNQ